jgi:hypothetical protein
VSVGVDDGCDVVAGCVTGALPVGAGAPDVPREVAVPAVAAPAVLDEVGALAAVVPVGWDVSCAADDAAAPVAVPGSVVSAVVAEEVNVNGVVVVLVQPATASTASAPIVAHRARVLASMSNLPPQYL